MQNDNKNYMAFGFILGLALIISAGIGSFTFYKLRSMDYISTTGSAKKAVVSDKVKWASSITQRVQTSTIKDGYTKLDSDLKAVKEFMSTNGITEDSITISPVLMNEIWDNNNQSQTSGILIYVFCSIDRPCSYCRGCSFSVGYLKWFHSRSNYCLSCKAYLRQNIQKGIK